VSVGGTLLTKSGSTYNETVWPDTSGGCANGSPYGTIGGGVVPKPSWQHDPGCLGRTGNDVAAVARNVACYDSYDYGGWLQCGGTSVATPLIAGVFALAGNASKQHGGKAFWTLSKSELDKDFHYISVGTDGCPAVLEGSYLCTAGTGQYGTYSGPTGWGTPNGIGAF
jgi:subtilase family serine protease